MNNPCYSASLAVGATYLGPLNLRAIETFLIAWNGQTAGERQEFQSHLETEASKDRQRAIVICNCIDPYVVAVQQAHISQMALPEGMREGARMLCLLWGQFLQAKAKKKKPPEKQALPQRSKRYG